MSRAELVDQLSLAVRDPHADTVALTLDRDDAWEVLGALAHGSGVPGVMLRSQDVEQTLAALRAHARHLLAPRPQSTTDAQACVARSRAISQLAARIGRLESADLFRLAPVGP